MVFMIVFIPLALPASWAIDTWGLQEGGGPGRRADGGFGLLRGLFALDYGLTMIHDHRHRRGAAAAAEFHDQDGRHWFRLRNAPR